MKIYYCDHCRTEIGPHVQVQFVAVIEEHRMDYELCRPCLWKLREWFQGAKS